MKETSYYELKMPDSNDTIDVSVLNNNMKRLDDVLILTVIGRNAETSEFVKKCCAPYIMIQNLGEETVTIYDRRWPEDMWEDNKIVIEPSKFHIYRVANSVNANFLVLDNKECNFRYFITAEQAIAEGGGGGGGGTTDYNELDNQPKINGFTLVGNKSFKELGLLNDDGKIKSDYLPPFVDNMDSYDTEADFPRPGVEDRLYLDKSTNLAYVWAGTDYACIGTPLALGITHETAGYGDESRAAYNHSLSEHARVDATKTEGSSQNGYVKINEVETKVYEHPGTGTNPHGTTKTDVGLGNVLDAKQVTVTEQAYSDTEKAQARKNIGAGTSSFSGKYSDLAEIPSEFTPAEHNHDDLYAHKTSVSSSKEGGETTSVINVTDAKAQMAMVAKISGKTQKVVQFANKATVTCSSGVSERPAVTAERSFIANHIYYATANQLTTLTSVTRNTLTLSEVGGQIILFENSGENFHLSAGRHDWRFTVSATKNCTVNYWGNNPNTTLTVNNIMVFDLTEMYGAGKEPTLDQCKSIFNSYVPEGTYLWNAPVESVVSVGKNRLAPYLSLDITSDGNTTCTRKGGTYLVNSSGAASKTASFRIASNVKVTSGMKISGCPTGGGSSAYELLVSDGTNTARDYGSGANITFNSDSAYVNIVVRSGATASNKEFKPMISVSGGEYAEPYETTVLVPSAVKNLPDYGLGIVQSDGTILANEVDFENGTYVQKVTKKKVKDISSDWGMPSANSYVYCSGLKDKKPGLYNLLMSTFNNHPNAAAAELLNGECKGNATTETIYFMDKSCASVEAFKAKYGETEIVYELNSHKTTPLSDYLRPLPVEQGGTLTLVNEHNLDMSSVIKYKKEVN